MKITKQRLEKIIKEELSEIQWPWSKSAPEETLVQHGEGWRWPGHRQATPHGREPAVPPEAVEDIVTLLARTPETWRTRLITYIVNLHQKEHLNSTALHRKLRAISARRGWEKDSWRNILQILFKDAPDAGLTTPDFFKNEFVAHLDSISRLPLYRDADKTQETSETVWKDYEKTLRRSGVGHSGIELG